MDPMCTLLDAWSPPLWILLALILMVVLIAPQIMMQSLRRMLSLTIQALLFW